MIKKLTVRLVGALAGVVAVGAYAASGDLDTTFDTDGIVITDTAVGNNDEIRALAIDSSDRIVAAGYSGSSTNGNFVITRYNADGSLDATFGTAGEVEIEDLFSATGDNAYGVAIDGDGKIVVAGTVAGRFGNSEIGVARFNADGSLDTSFDTDGSIITNYGAIDSAYAMAIQADGKIVVAGAVDNVITVIRYNTDGSLDATFDTDGIAVGAAAQAARAVAIDGSGNIVVAGYTANNTTADFIVQRFTSAGALDATFDGDGTVSTDFGATKDQAYSVTIDGSGRIVAAGYSGGSFAIARYTSGGALDTTFDTDGLVTTDASAGNDIAYSVAVDGAGKIVAGGIFTSNFGIARYNEDGSLDTTFTPTGRTQADVAGGGLQDHAFAMVLDANGYIVLGGRAYAGTKYDFALARFVADAAAPQDCGDAPAPYPTLLANDGACSTIDPAGPYLGAVSPDAEADGQVSANADGDDAAATDDEDGLSAAPNLRTSLSTTVSVDVTVPVNASLNAWIDWNQDGDWLDAGEQIAYDVVATDGTNLLTVDVPADASLGTTAARFRVCSAAESCNTPIGLAPDGEVEDHLVTVTSGEPGTFYFTEGTGYVNEGAGTVTVYVGRADGSGGAVSVEYLMRSGTAIDARVNRRGIPQGDYFKAYGVVSWADNDTAVKPITIEIADDQKIEPTEEFYVLLHIANGGATISDLSRMTVVIEDND